MFLTKVFGVLSVLYFKDACNMDYEGHRSYRLLPRTKKKIDTAGDLKPDKYLNFWSQTSIPDNNVAVLVAPTNHCQSFEEHLKTNNLNKSLLIRNIRSTFSYSRQKRSIPHGEISFDQFMRHEEINNYLRSLARKFPEIARIEPLGKSYEGRDILALRISTGDYNRPTIFIDAGVHGREWIAPPVALYVILQLVQVSQNSALFHKINWVIAPVINPDGYEYTFKKERFWRKTRSKGHKCDGVDINRNFGFHWMATGASNLECSEVYGGPKQFSEAESIVLGNYLWNNRNTIKLYVSLHGYGSFILYPWAFTTAVAWNQKEMHNLGIAVAAAIGKVYGTQYKVGAPSRVLYAVAGGSADYAKGVAGIELAYTIELPGAGPYGFNPPPSKIKPIVQETWEGFKVFHKYIEGKYG